MNLRIELRKSSTVSSTVCSTEAIGCLLDYKRTSIITGKRKYSQMSSISEHQVVSIANHENVNASKTLNLSPYHIWPIPEVITPLIEHS